MKAKTTSLIERLEASGQLPTPPVVVVRLLDLSRRTDITIQEVSDTIAMDSELTANMLQFVNSPLAGVAKEVTSLEQAVVLLGMKAVKLMALSFSMLSTSANTQCPGFDRDHFALHSLGCGVAARVLATLTKIGSPQEAFVAGLLSQIGRSVFARAFPQEYGLILQSAQRIPDDLPEREKAAFGETYASVGAQVLRHWGIPDVLCGAIHVFRDTENHQDSPELANVLYFGEWASSLICPAPGCEPYDPATFVEKGKHIFGIGEEACLLAMKEITSKMEQMRILFKLPQGTMCSIDQIEAAMRRRMNELSMALHIEYQKKAEANEDLLKRATTDALTGVGNRAAFDSRLSLELERAARNGDYLALLMIDIDHFKKLNDTHGHQAGDFVLQTIGCVLDRNIRKVDSVARYGGDEFAVIASGVTTEGAMQLAERLREIVEHLAIAWEDIHLNTSISIGMVILTEIMDGHDALKMIKTADERLYKAKCTGRNNIEMAIDHKPVIFTLQPS